MFIELLVVELFSDSVATSCSGLLQDVDLTSGLKLDKFLWGFQAFANFRLG